MAEQSGSTLSGDRRSGFRESHLFNRRLWELKRETKENKQVEMKGADTKEIGGSPNAGGGERVTQVHNNHTHNSLPLLFQTQLLCSFEFLPLFLERSLMFEMLGRDGKKGTRRV